METGNSLGCLQQREVVHTRFPACSVLLLCAAAGKSVGSCICRAEMSTADTNAWFNPLWCLGFALHVPGTNQWGVSKLPLTYTLLQDWCRCWVLSPRVNAVKNKWRRGSEHSLGFTCNLWISRSRRYSELGCFPSATHQRGGYRGTPLRSLGACAGGPSSASKWHHVQMHTHRPVHQHTTEGCPGMLGCNIFSPFCLSHLHLSVTGSFLCMHMHAHTYPCSKWTHLSHKKKPFDHFSLTVLHF